MKYKMFRIEDPVSWDTHRGGWDYVLEILQSEFHSNDGTLFLSGVENFMRKGNPIEEPWTGFIHQVPKNNLPRFLDLERLLKNETWLKSLKHCKGLFTISNYVKKYLDSKNLPIVVNNVNYPIDFEFQEFNYRAFLNKPRKILFIGEFMRNFQSFFDLDAGDYRKILLCNETFRRANINPSHTVKVIDRLDDKEYDQYLSESIVFLNLYDAPANTTVVECLGRNTPLLINKLPGVVEYLGEDYPFYYNTLSEASKKLKDDRLIKQTSLYLSKSENKEKVRKEHFVNAIHSSLVYRSLEIPVGQKQIEFLEYDVTVVITSYRRIYNIDRLLKCFCNQNFSGSFEILIWNNNLDSADFIYDIYKDYENLLNIRLINSSENYYCAMRLSMAHLMQGSYLLICDDDVVPGPKYIQSFWDKLSQYGPEAILCARGHSFELHELDENTPENVWEFGNHIEFFDESKDDIRIHFFHSDNCFIPKSILLKVNAFEWANLDFILVDDYWMSFIISHELGIPIWKIKLNTQMSFTPCADSKEIAMFHNPNVRRERLNFYIYHMKKGWPKSVINAPLKSADNKKKNTSEEINSRPHFYKFNKMHEMEQLRSAHFETYDISVLICTYTRVHNLPEILKRFQAQIYSGSFELVIWNNNSKNTEEINKLYNIYKRNLNIKVIHSTHNYYSKPRIALISLLRGSKLVFCDDDVLPKQNYLSHLFEKHQKFGPNVVVSVSGQSFITNQMDESHPHLIWESGGVKLQSFDQDESTTHYFHANTCILSKKLLRKASIYKMPSPEIALIDDYWLSFIFSHKLKIKLLKIKGDKIMRFTLDSADEKISMYKNPQVRYQKVKFHIYHRGENWCPTLNDQEFE